MKEDNRVLARTQARELSAKELEAVSGALRTLTACTFSAFGGTDGDASIGEC